MRDCMINTARLNDKLEDMATVQVPGTLRSINNNDTNSTTNIEKIEKVVHRMVNKYWPVRLPANVFCSEFYTSLQFGTHISFGYFKQYMCLQLVSIEQGQDKDKNALVKIKSQLIYEPKQPGAPDALSELCDYWAKKEAGIVEPNPALDEKLQNSGPGIDKTCMLLSAGKILIPDNLPNQYGNVAAMLGGQVVITELPDVILKDPRPNPTFPPPEALYDLFAEQLQKEAKETNATEPFAFELADRRIFEKIPPDAWAILGGVVLFIIMKLIRKKQKQRKRRKEMLAGLAEDMDAMANMAKASKLTAEEYKAFYAEAQKKVEEMDFSKYEKRKKRKQKWAEAEEKEKMQNKRKRLRELAVDQHFEIGDLDTSMIEDGLLDDISDDVPDVDEFNELFESESTGSSYTNELAKELGQFTDRK